MTKTIFVCDLCGDEWVGKDESPEFYSDTKLFLSRRQPEKNLHIKKADICVTCFTAINEVIGKRLRGACE